MEILIVDDDKKILDDITNALSPTGYKCVPISNPVTALSLYKNHKFDVVISDVRMPQMSGIELLKQIHAYDQDARVIIVTAFGDLETAILAINNRAYAFFGKPIDFTDLVMTLRQIEKEISQEEAPVKVDYDKLRKEHSKLKRSYEKLLEILHSYEEGSSL